LGQPPEQVPIQEHVRAKAEFSSVTRWQVQLPTPVDAKPSTGARNGLGAGRGLYHVVGPQREVQLVRPAYALVVGRQVDDEFGAQRESLPLDWTTGPDSDAAQDVDASDGGSVPAEVCGRISIETIGGSPLRRVDEPGPLGRADFARHGSGHGDASALSMFGYASLPFPETEHGTPMTCTS
jgi:hypothetical protein